jgi:hypothetical protein
MVSTQRVIFKTVRVEIMVGNSEVWSVQREQFFDVLHFHKVEPNAVTYISLKPYNDKSS